MTDADTQSGPNVTEDPNGNVQLPYTSIAQGGTDNYLVTMSNGSQVVVPYSQIVGPNPGVTSNGGTIVLTPSLARSLSLI